MDALALSMALHCFLFSLSMYFGVTPIFMDSFLTFQWLIFYFISASFSISSWTLDSIPLHTWVLGLLSGQHTFVRVRGILLLLLLFFSSMSLIRLLLCRLQVILPSSLLSFWPGGLVFSFVSILLVYCWFR